MVYYDSEYGHWVGTDPVLDDSEIVAQTKEEAELGLKLLLGAVENRSVMICNARNGAKTGSHCGSSHHLHSDASGVE